MPEVSFSLVFVLFCFYGGFFCCYFISRLFFNGMTAGFVFQLMKYFF